MAKKRLKLKVCGMREPQNIEGVLDMDIVDFMGFIFYDKSPRYVGKIIPKISDDIASVGVFVNEEISELEIIYSTNNLQYVQLHGDESAEYCKALKEKNIGVIKAFRVMDANDLEDVGKYEGAADYFLFDTKATVYGGSGKSFDWGILDSVNISTPFFISGGIDLDNIDDLLKLELNNFVGIDVNSGFELKPGYKDLEKLKKLKTLISTV